MEKLLGGKLYKARSMTELAVVEHDFFTNKNGGLPSRAGYALRVCECCGFHEKPNSPEQCLCAGTEWFQLPDGRVECMPHRVARAIDGGARRKWWDFRR